MSGLLARVIGVVAFLGAVFTVSAGLCGYNGTCYTPIPPTELQWATVTVIAIFIAVFAYGLDV